MIAQEPWPSNLVRPLQLDPLDSINKGRVLVWVLEPNGPGPTLPDLCKPAHPGTYNGYTGLKSYTPANGALALAFNGSSQYLAGTPPLNFQDNTPFSIMSVFATSSGSTQAICTTWSFGLGSGGGIHFQINDNTAGTMSLLITPFNPSVGVNFRFGRSTDATFADGNANTAVVTYDGSGSTAGMAFYKNGVSSATVSISNASPGALTNPIFQLGYLNAGGGAAEYFVGRYRLLSIWNRALKPREVWRLRDSSAGFLREPFISYKSVGGGNFLKDVAETITASDAAAETMVALAALAETITASDAAASVTAASGALAEAANLVDAVAEIYGQVGVIAETIAASDAPASAMSSDAATAETITANDAPASAMAVSKTVAESVAATDAPASAMAATGDISESVTLLDVVSTAGNYVMSVGETLSLADAVVGMGAFSVVVGENLNLTDAIAATMAAVRAVGESVAFTDTVARVGGGDFFVGVSEVLTPTDAVTVSGAFFRSISEAISLLDLPALSGLVPVAPPYNTLSGKKRVRELQGDGRVRALSGRKRVRELKGSE